MPYRPCDRCTDKMILRETGAAIFYGIPEISTIEREWWCGCGHTMTAKPLTRRTLHKPTARELWEELNGISD